jgi:hypothetical protein
MTRAFAWLAGVPKEAGTSSPRHTLAAGRRSVRARIEGLEIIPGSSGYVPTGQRVAGMRGGDDTVGSPAAAQG